MEGIYEWAEVFLSVGFESQKLGVFYKELFGAKIVIFCVCAVSNTASSTVGAQLHRHLEALLCLNR